MAETIDSRISEAEYAVMEVLWRADRPLTANAVADQVAKSQGWTLATVKTLLSRLLSKGAVAHEEDGRRYLYRPLIARGDYAAGESIKLVDRLFGGRLSPLVAHLAERDQLTPDDIDEIEALLREIKG